MLSKMWILRRMLTPMGTVDGKASVACSCARNINSASLVVDAAKRFEVNCDCASTSDVEESRSRLPRPPADAFGGPEVRIPLAPPASPSSTVNAGAMCEKLRTNAPPAAAAGGRDRGFGACLMLAICVAL